MEYKIVCEADEKDAVVELRLAVEPDGTVTVRRLNDPTLKGETNPNAVLCRFMPEKGRTTSLGTYFNSDSVMRAGFKKPNSR